MLHLIGFAPSNARQRDLFRSLYQAGDICVFTDAGLLNANSLELQGDGYLLQHPSLTLPLALEGSNYPTIDHSQLLTLIVEHGPCTSWY